MDHAKIYLQFLIDLVGALKGRRLSWKQVAVILSGFLLVGYMSYLSHNVLLIVLQMLGYGGRAVIQIILYLILFDLLRPKTGISFRPA